MYQTMIVPNIFEDMSEELKAPALLGILFGSVLLLVAGTVFMSSLPNVVATLSRVFQKE